MNLDRPETTLFMIESLDGKISTGDTDEMDIDKDFPKINGVKEGLCQYYELEQLTDLYSFNSGKVQAKIGVNTSKSEVEKSPVNFMIVDNRPHLNSKGVDYFLKRGQKFFLITTDKSHPAFERKDDSNVNILYYEKEIDFEDLFARLRNDYGVDRITIQTGGTLNSVLLRKGLIDHASIIIAPVLIGGKDTSTLIDGESLHLSEDLKKVKALKLVNCDILKDSYIHLYYDVINETEIIGE
ncbi:MAG: dihydrofolate reductase family protein [Ignavibacteriales bacterium]